MHVIIYIYLYVFKIGIENSQKIKQNNMFGITTI